jgi:hypothetical protein
VCVVLSTVSNQVFLDGEGGERGWVVVRGLQAYELILLEHSP